MGGRGSTIKMSSAKASNMGSATTDFTQKITPRALGPMMLVPNSTAPSTSELAYGPKLLDKYSKSD